MKIFVGNLSWNAEESDLRKSFGRFGTINELKIIMDKESGKSRGFAFISFAERAGAETAIDEMNGAEFLGRNLRVSEANERH